MWALFYNKNCPSVVVNALRVNHKMFLSSHAISCTAVFIMRKNANIHHYEMYIIGQNIMASEKIIIPYTFSLPDYMYT